MNLVYILLILVLSFTACGGGGGSNGGSSTNSGSNQGEESIESGQSLESGVISELTFNSRDQVTIEFSNTVSANDQYYLQIYSYDADGSNNSYEISNSENFGDHSSSAFLLEANENTTIDFHQMLREREQELDPDFLLTENTHQNVSQLKLTNTTERNFKVLNSLTGGNNYDTITAQLVYETDHFKAWMDIRNLDALTEAEIEDLFEDFDEIVPVEQELYGIESDVDSDGKFNILLTQVVNEIGASAGGIVTGFFYAIDLFSSNQYAVSNETEIFYTFVPDPYGDYGAVISKEFALSNILPGVLPHEYQHMINFNQHYFLNEGSPEASFLNEALSHLAEDIHSVNENNYMTQTGLENPARVAGYLNSIDSICFSCGSSLYQRGGSYLFIRYLYEQAELGNFSNLSSGAELIGNLLDTNLTGISNITNAVFGEVDNSLFRQLLGQFGLAVFLSENNLSSDDRFQITGINLRDAQDDNRGTILQGPRIRSLNNLSLNQTIGGTSISYVELSGEDIIDLNYEVTLELNDSDNAGVYLIQTSN